MYTVQSKPQAPLPRADAYTKHWGRQKPVDKSSATRQQRQLQLLNDGSGELVRLGLATQVTGQRLSFGKSIEGGLLDPVGVLVEAHVTQHHHGAEEQSGRVGEALASDIGGGAVDGLEDGALVADVAGGRQAETANETGAHVGQDVTVQVGHDEDLVVVGDGVRDHLQAGVVEELGVELDVRVVLGDFLCHIKEKTVAHLHDGGLVDNADLLAANLVGLLEGEAQDALRRLPGDELDALNNTVDHDMLDTRVLALGVLADQDGVDVIVRCLEAGDRAAGPQVGEEVECAAESKVERDVALANGSLANSVSMYWRLQAKACCQTPALPTLTARGPFRAILFFLMLSIAASGIAVLPSFRIGVTSQGSQVIGVYHVSAMDQKQIP